MSEPPKRGRSKPLGPTTGVFFEAPPELKARFKATCQAKGWVDAQVFRAFMVKFIEKYARG